MKPLIFKKDPILNNEKGSVLLLALILLSVLTVMGLSSINTTSTEYQIVRNERIYQTNFYHAESCANEGAFYLEKENNSSELIPEYTNKAWVHPDDGTIDFSNADNWITAGGASDNAGTSSITNIDNSSFSTIAEGLRDCSSLDIGSSRLYEFAVYGKSASNNGSAVIEIGYLKRF
ncbi:MAG: hypothetical protein HUK40_20485 [Desulfobacter sp.]|nr:hypothetical protein [Desulfobacter sp.]